MLPLMAVAFLLGLGLGAAQPNVMSLLHDRSPEGRVGEALGVRTTIMNSSHVVLPLVFGAFGSVLGAGPAFWLMAILLGAGGWTAWRRMNVERPPDPDARMNPRCRTSFRGRVTAEQQAASFAAALAQMDGASPIWLFGYGSLIWNPEVTYDRRFAARVHGYHRRLCLWSRVNRGTLDCPGLVAGLDRGGSCAGIVYRLPAETARDELERLWDREMFMGSYAPRWLDCRVDNVPRRRTKDHSSRRSRSSCAVMLPTTRAS